MHRVLDEIRWTLAVILAVDGAAVALACLIAFAAGSFDRQTVGLLILGAAGLLMLMVVGSAGGMPMGQGMGSGGVNSIGGVHNEMIARQALESDAVHRDLRRRALSSVGLALIALSLLIVGFAVVG